MKIWEFNFGRELQENIYFLLEIINFPHTSSQALKKITVDLSLGNRVLLRVCDCVLSENQ